MAGINNFLERTKSATEHLFSGIQEYEKLLTENRVPGVNFLGSNSKEFEEESANWFKENKTQIDRSIEAQDRYCEELFAKAMLCGCVLQFAHKGIEMHSTNAQEDPAISSLKCRQRKCLRKFCIGREILGIPLGLIIYAGRNHHTHFEESPKPSAEHIIDKLSEYKSTLSGKVYRSGYFDLESNPQDNLSDNFLALLGWHSYIEYRTDMECMLKST